MTTYPLSNALLRRLLLQFAMLLALGTAPAVAGLSLGFAAVDSGAMPHAQGNGGEVIIMMCRHGGIDPMQQMQAEPQDLPLLCVAALADEDAVRMTPEQMRDLIDRAARSGDLSVILLHPQ